jgi:monofunctional biosynthetic peptidoglycan transglycosylase
MTTHKKNLGTALRYAGYAGGIVGLLFFLWIWLVWPPPVWYRWAWPRETSYMAMRRHEAAEQGTSYRAEYHPVALEKIAPSLREAVTAGEDQRFLAHDGIDFVELRKAIGYRADSFSWTSARDRGELFAAIGKARRDPAGLRGASTLSQQLAKNLYLSASRSPLRKIKEALLAWRLEYWLGKDRIMELYLNVVELGPGIWGAEAASREYFKKSARALSVEESAALAGTLPFPLRSNPAYRPGRMRWRQNMILRWLRGEPVEIPPAPEVALDSLLTIPDTVLVPRITPGDSLLRPDTIPQRPDTIPAPTDTGAVSPPAEGASPG